MSKFSEWLRTAKLDEERPIVGISANEIDELAAAQAQTVLPVVYQEFLAECGKSAGLFMRDAAFFFPEVMELKRDLLEMLVDADIEVVIPPEAFVFGAYQGFQFHYFLCDGAADPAVYQIDDGGDMPRLICESFSEYIHRGIEQYHNAYYR